MADTEKFMSCLAALKEEDGEITSNLLSHVSFSILVIAEERDLLDILERTSGMSFVRAETTAPGINLAILTGTLAQTSPNHTAFQASETVTLLLDGGKMGKHTDNRVTLCARSVTKLLRRKP